MTKSNVGFLEGKRIRLRLLNPESDAALVVCWMNDPATRDVLGDKRALPFSEETEKQWLRKLYCSEPPEKIVFGIELKKTDRLIGVIGLHDIDWISRKTTIGIKIGLARWRGQGYGTEATKLLQEYAFETLGLNRILAEILIYNGASLQCFKRCGYHREGILRQAMYKNGQFHDVALLSILRSEWVDTQKESKKPKR